MSSYRFDLEKALAAWRRSLQYNRAFTADDLDELEQHLRDQVAGLVALGLNEEAAFRHALREMGNYGTAEAEYRKVYWGKLRRRHQLVSELIWRTAMLKNYVKVALRSLRQQKGYTFINMAGLAIGIACCMLVGLYLRQELSYDRWHKEADHLYRIVRDVQREDGTDYSARTPVPLGPTLKEEFPDVIDVVRFWRSFEATLSHGPETLREPGLYFADPGVFDLFSLVLLRGDPRTALSSPGTMVLTESAARRYFGDADPMGQVLDYDGYPGSDSLQFTVTGILQDLPTNTHLSFTALASLVGIETEHDNFGSYKPLWTYVLLPENGSPEQLEAQFPAFLARHVAPSMPTVMRLEPITSIHLDSRYVGGFKPGSQTTYLYVFGLGGLFVLCIACINFINLTTARVTKRAREVGMRKVLGAHRKQLVGQFLGEAMLLSAMVVVLAVALTALVLPLFNSQFGLTLSLDLGDRFLWMALPLLVLGVGALAGWYPALVLSRYRPITALRARATSGASGALLRKGLVVFQFTISIVLISSTVIVYSQLDYLRHKDLGFDKEQVVVMPYSPNEAAVRAALEQHPGVVRTTVSQRVPVNTIGADGQLVKPEGFQDLIRIDSYLIDDAFLETFGVELVTGRNLSDERGADLGAVLVNETAVQRFGWGTPQEALGREIQWGDVSKEVVGVVKDFHLASMHEAITPTVLQIDPEATWWRTFISAKIRPENVVGTLAFIEETWRSLTPEGAYEYLFLDESLEQLHRADAQFGRLFTGISLLAILIACLGLFGLAAFTAEQRTKEIGVRKVLGASVAQVVVLLSKDFLRLVALALLIAVPIAYFGMQRWLDDFAYRIAVGPSVFLLTGGIVLVITVLTVSFQSIKAALSDPVKSLRYE